MIRMGLCTISFSFSVTIFLIIMWMITFYNATSFFSMNPIMSYSSPNSGLYDSGCVYYDSANRTIHLCGGSTNLSSIDRMINNSDVLNNTSDKIWVLNANVSVENGATLFINSTDALWLKIKSSPYYPHSIVAYGNLVMNGTRIQLMDSI